MQINSLQEQFDTFDLPSTESETDDDPDSDVGNTPTLEQDDDTFAETATEDEPDTSSETESEDTNDND